MLITMGMTEERHFTLRLRLVGAQGIMMGPGRADLLALIEQTGSIAAAGRQMGMSYKRAWALVESMNGTFQTPLVVATKGGAGGGGAQLTALGHELLAAYRGLQAATEASGASFLSRFETALAVPPGGKAG